MWTVIPKERLRRVLLKMSYNGMVRGVLKILCSRGIMMRNLENNSQPFFLRPTFKKSVKYLLKIPRGMIV